MIISEKFIQEIQRFLGDQMLVFTVNESLPTFTGMSEQNKNK